MGRILSVEKRIDACWAKYGVKESLRGIANRRVGHERMRLADGLVVGIDEFASFPATHTTDDHQTSGNEIGKGCRRVRDKKAQDRMANLILCFVGLILPASLRAAAT